MPATSRRADLARALLPKREASTEGELYLALLLNAILLKAGGRMVVSDSYYLGQEPREVLVEQRPGHIVISLGEVESVVHERSGLWRPEARA